MHKKLLLSNTALFVLLSLVVTVKADYSTWSQTYGGGGLDEACAVIETSDGGYAIAGHTYSFGAGGQDFWLVKTDSAGVAQWDKTYGFAGNDGVSSLVETPSGGYIIAGYIQIGAGREDFWLVKTDEFGNREGDVAFGGSDYDRAYSLVATSDGGYAIAGYTRSFAGAQDCWLIKVDADGYMEWNRTYGGTSYDQARSLVETSDGGYALAGVTSSFGAGSVDILLVKTDVSGNMEWNKTYGGILWDCAYSLVESSDGGYAIAGYTESFGAGENDFWLVKTDEFGNMEWNRTYGGPDYDRASSLVVTSDGGYAIAGYTQSFGAGSDDFWLIKTDGLGNVEWNKTYGGPSSDDAYSLVVTSDGGYAIAGSTSSYGRSTRNFWLVKTDSYGGMYVPDKYEFDLSVEENNYTVVVSSNSTIEDCYLHPTSRRLSFSVICSTGTVGYWNVSIPEDLLWGDFSVFSNHEPLVEGVDYTRTYNGTHNIFYATYNQNSHSVAITGTNIVPEYSSLLLPSILTVAALVIVVYKKKLLKSRTSEN